MYNKTFYIIAFIGLVVTLFLLVNAEVKFDGKTMTDFKSRAEIMVIISNFFACLFSILLSSITIPNEREKKQGHLILVRSIKKWEYGLSLTLGNIMISILCFLLLSSSFYIGAMMLGDRASLLLILKSQMVLLLIVIVLSALVSLFSIYLPGSIAAFIGIVIYFVGVFYETLRLLINSLDNLLSPFLKALFYLIPNIDALQKQAGVVISGGNPDIHILLSLALYGFATIVLITLLFRREV